MPVRRANVAVLACLVTGLALSGCSNRQPAVTKAPQNGTGTASAAGGVQLITVTTGVDLRFHPSTLIVRRGVVRIVLVNSAANDSGAPHDLQVTGLPGAVVPLTAAGHQSSITFTAPAPGTYKFVCTIHATQGQTGKLIVR